jgi:hypothetical protein
LALYSGLNQGKQIIGEGWICENCETDSDLTVFSPDLLLVPEAGLGLRIFPWHDRNFQRTWPFLYLGAGTCYQWGVEPDNLQLSGDSEFVYPALPVQWLLAVRASLGMDIFLKTFDPMERDKGGLAITLEAPFSYQLLNTDQSNSLPFRIGLNLGFSYRFGTTR